MKIIFVDNEEHAHFNFCYEMRNRENVSSLDCFFTPEEALAHAQHNPVDCAFLDIDLGDDVNGIDLGHQLKALHPQLEIAFLTASDAHAIASYQLGGCAYITKPFSSSELDRALEVMHRLCEGRTNSPTVRTPSRATVQMRTFGNFDLLVDNRALFFKNAKAKEALAFLVHQRGGSVSGAQILFALWETQEYTTVTATYVRRSIYALEDELKAAGIENILLRSRNCYSIDVSRIECDSYDLLNGSKQAAATFDGEYMRQYSWGEGTIPLLERAAAKLLTPPETTI